MSCRNFSNNRVNKSGNYLAQNSFDFINESEFEEHLQVFNYWRALHSYPMNIIYMNLNRRISKLGIKDAIIVQRLKRSPSILNKLSRIKGMKLRRMQDIGGVRIIVKKISDIYKIRDDINKAFPHKICDEKNYINEPKCDGYRCLHMIFEINNLKDEKFNDLKIELQIRTELQHQWATAVEILGLYDNTSYKSGQGDEKTREFLCLCSNLFALNENTPIDKKYYGVNLYQELKNLNDKLNILDHLKGLTVAFDQHNKIIKANSKICLILLKLDERTLNLWGFSNNSDAEKQYEELEKKIDRENKNWDVVLVSIDKIKSLQKAFPNYYLDSRSFVKKIEGFIAKATSKP
jgi:relA/spoT domain protein